tara:strand:- start:614 stop:871 length:258 start_codon:yes stop_codon:yes gene_type:complete
VAKVRRGGKDLYLGRFATAEAAALSVARTLGEQTEQEAAERAAAALQLLTSDEGQGNAIATPPEVVVDWERLQQGRAKRQRNTTG